MNSILSASTLFSFLKMAIIPSMPGLEVTIEVDNIALPEHEYEDEDTTTAGHGAFDDSVTRYIEVPSGAEFSIRWLLRPPFESTAAIHATVMLDGFYLHAPIRETGDKDNVQGYKYAKTIYKEDRQSFAQSFRFSELEIGKYDASPFYYLETDRSADDSSSRTIQDLEHQLEGIGCITVYFYQIIGETEFHATVVPQLELTQCDPMSEKIAQKNAPKLGDVLTHQASLTAPQAMHSSLFHEIQTEDAPFAAYTFHYRSRGALQSLGVIPRPPSPSRSPTLSPKLELDTRDPDTMTREELIAALTKTKEHGEAFVRIKREREDVVAAASSIGDDDDDLVWICTRPAKKRAFVVLED
ncbi:uncharacterized protein EKO05_0007174 [Ascochyta rabiei]|uniref:uncharacterized protein n=1 Tax=Didymella rabiei TaxID=5454 RepID=UPI002207E962|nr:uncharacterized protein EKO05_0007174 [Ascochyta rabiei]UPX16788.1 hypothetical protein EKO05_0007174 [Ascochyta rabiei]